jgi:hypothetical protein
VGSVGEDCRPQLFIQLANQTESWLIRKACNKFNPLRVIPKELGILEIVPLFLEICFAFDLVILKTHKISIFIPWRVSRGYILLGRVDKLR